MWRIYTRKQLKATGARTSVNVPPADGRRDWARPTSGSDRGVVSLSRSEEATLRLTNMFGITYRLCRLSV